MATAITTAGKYQMFKTGWRDYANKVKLYTDANVLVDTQNVTFSFSNGTLVATNIVFDVGTGTNDVSYVELIYANGGTDTVLYTKDLDSLYDFPTAGTLTIETWTISISSSEVTTAGRSQLLQNGWEGMDIAMVEAQGAVQFFKGTGFTANAGNGTLPCDDTVIFDITAGTSSINIFAVGFLGGLAQPSLYYIRSLPQGYSFTNAGTLSVSGFVLNLSV